MTTVKVKLRPSVVKGKPWVIYYQITHNRKIQNITTKLRVYPDDWNVEEERVVEGAPNWAVVQNRVDSDMESLKKIICDLENGGGVFSVADVVKRYKSLYSNVMLLDYMRVQVEHLRATNRFGTAKNYEKTMNSFSGFLGKLQMPISALNERVVADYNAFLVKKGVTRNSVSFYMRILRAVYNKAVRQKLVEQTFPFVDVYTGVDCTRKRAVPEKIIAQICSLELEQGSAIALCRDMFVFSYCARGMAFVDMVYLKKKDVQNGVICYKRRKTGQLLNVRVEHCARQIIDRYANNESAYVFPILKSLDAAGAYEQYQEALNSYNRLLGRLSDMVKCDCKLTSYTSRHSWATAARNHNIPISIISQGMGHSSELTTQIYLKMLESTVIDEANKEIVGELELVFYQRTHKHGTKL